MTGTSSRPPAGAVPAPLNSRPPPGAAPVPPILKYFAAGHLPQPLRDISEPFGVLAHQMVELLPPGAELAAGLRKLLEAKDCFVRALVP